MKSVWKTLILLSCLTLWAGCADDAADNTLPDATSGDANESDGDGTTGTDTGVNGDASDCSAIAGDDADGDGIPNGFEDKNLNCVQDEGETDWQDADTDGDGIPDGDEDINRNGQKDPNELNDPLNSDSNGNGVPDGQEPSAIVCTADALSEVGTVAAVFANTSLALPTDFTSEPQQAASGATFSNGSDIFGYVVQTNAASQNVAQENGQNISAVAQAGNRPTNRATKEFTTWSHPELPGRKAIRNELLFAYGAGTPNEGADTKDPAALRDEILSAISGSTVASGETGTPCAEVINHQVALLRTDGTLVTAGILTCESNLNVPENDFLFTDFFGATVIAPNTFNPNDFNCEDLEVEAGGGQVDFIWVIDNSGSMADEQDAVARTAETFLQTLIDAGVDWRLGVTTTEAHQLADTSGGRDSHRNYNPSYLYGPDELVKTINECAYCSGFRGTGFMTFSDNIDEVRANFGTYITTDGVGASPNDSYCDRGRCGSVEACDIAIANGTTPYPYGANVCGSGLESGLEAALYTMRSAVNLDPSTNADHERFYLRPNATRIVVFVSDEEDQQLKFQVDSTTFESYPPGDATRVATTNNYIQQYRELNAITAAIVGDVGKANGGVCDALIGDGVEGAQHGLGYIDVSTALGGVFGSICNSDLQATIDAIIDLAIGIASNYTLSESPIASSIKVAVDDQEIPRSRAQGWDYNADQNAIVFFGVSLSESSRISVAYKMWEPNDN